MLKKTKVREENNAALVNKKKGIMFYKILQDGSADEIRESFINDINATGLIFETHEPIDQGVTLECEIYQPRDYQEDIISSTYLLAKVVWVRKSTSCSGFNGNRNTYRVKIKFLTKKS